MLLSFDGALFGTTLLASATAKGVYETIHHNHDTRGLRARQATPPTTTSPVCDDDDGYFYVTAHNYTYQIQCATTYTGEQILTQSAVGFTACISQCAMYNHDNSTSQSFCVGINFNAATDTSTGDCTLFDEFSAVPNQASEEGSIEDAALLIYGPTGQTFAAPELEPSIVVGGILTDSLVFTSVSQPVVPPSSVPPAISTAFVTSVVTVISCAPGVSNCPANGLSTSTSLFTTSAPVTPSATSLPSTPSVSISLGGVRPLTTISQPAASTTPIATAVSYSPPLVTLQATQTEIVPYTEYHVTSVVLCTQEATTSSCTTSATTQTFTGLRAEISCSPGLCSGVILATGTLAGMPGVFTGGCIVE